MTRTFFATLAAIALILANCLPSFANPAGHGGYGGHGGYVGHGGYGGRYGGHGGYGRYGGHGRYGGYGWYGGYGRHGRHYRGGAWIGPGWWGPYYPYYPYYYYPYYPYYPYYTTPPVVVPQQPEVYVQPAPPPAPQEQVCMTLNIEFDTNKAVIKPQYFNEVEKVAIFMEKYPQVKGIIEGHTDNVGSAKYNLRLSQRRAESVVNKLIEKYGINESRLAAKGYGMTRPIADNSTREGRQINRRTVANFGCVIAEK